MIEDLLQGCKKNNRVAQQKVYNYLSPKLYSVCKRYIKNKEVIEDILTEVFFTIFTKIHQLKEVNAFEGWARRIAINMCLQQLKKETNFNIYIEELPSVNKATINDNDFLEEQDLLKIIEMLPKGCQTVFNLYVIENYSHKDIAQELNITEGTSKSQLNFAKQKLKTLVNEHYFKLKAN